MTELEIDSLLDDGILKSIPVINLIVGVSNIAQKYMIVIF